MGTIVFQDETGPIECVAGRYWHALDDGRLQCDLCPRYCRLRDGQRGLCFVRGRAGDQMVLTSWGRSSGYCVDPIEKKPLNHFLPGTPVLSFGTAGCNLTCKFCQNWDISKSREFDTLADAARPETIARAARSLGCSSVAFTYNDPVIFLEYAVDVAEACNAAEIKTVAVTAGYICPEPRAEFFRHMDATNIDLKAFTENFYKNICGAELA
ncbi:MAG: AmmeMemoRadiSam system radical SAM enzyme, partial [Alphaproteobacteria bacterium]